MKAAVAAVVALAACRAQPRPAPAWLSFADQVAQLRGQPCDEACAEEALVAVRAGTPTIDLDGVAYDAFARATAACLEGQDRVCHELNGQLGPHLDALAEPIYAGQLVTEVRCIATVGRGNPCAEEAPPDPDLEDAGELLTGDRCDRMYDTICATVVERDTGEPGDAPATEVAAACAAQHADARAACPHDRCAPALERCLEVAEATGHDACLADHADCGR